MRAALRSLVVLLLLLLVPAAASSQDNAALVQAWQLSQGQERILSYASAVTVEPSGDLDVTETVKVVAENAMVLVVPAKKEGAVTGFEDLSRAGKVAVGEPKVVPAGFYAKEALTNLKLSTSMKSSASGRSSRRRRSHSRAIITSK